MSLWIKDPAALHAHLAARPDRIGLDTEFIRERTYWPQLALVQIAIGGTAADGAAPEGTAFDGADSNGVILLVDPLAPGIAEALAPMLADPAILKIMHSASEDLVAFKHACGVVPTPLFDTQQAAALTGIGGGLGYQKLVEQLTGAHASARHSGRRCQGSGCGRGASRKCHPAVYLLDRIGSA